MKYLSLGIKIATKSSHKYRHSSILIKGGRVLSFGHNHDSVHAEVNALKDHWKSETKGSILINFRLDLSGQLRNSFPCVNCRKEAKKYKVRKIIFSTEEGFKEFVL